jgi:transaldolase
MNQLESLKRLTTVVADTGDIEAMRTYRPQDATTNPSLLLKAAGLKEYQDLVALAIEYANERCSDSRARRELLIDKLSVNFGQKILEIVPGRVSTEVDARLSFDREATVAKARALIGLYREIGVPPERVLIKIAATWEGIRAAAQLEKEGIHCNLTLLFSFAQAVACAQAGVTLISPFVGRIYDWYLQARGGDDIPIDEDPGVESVTRIYNYIKRFDYPTLVMGASFRKAEQIVRLAGCDLLTISPELLEELEDRSGEMDQRLDADRARGMDLERLDLDEKEFRWMHNADAMAVEKLSDGIRRFYADGRKLEQLATEWVVAASS